MTVASNELWTKPVLLYGENSGPLEHVNKYLSLVAKNIFRIQFEGLNFQITVSYQHSNWPISWIWHLVGNDKKVKQSVNTKITVNFIYKPQIYISIVRDIPWGLHKSWVSRILTTYIDINGPQKTSSFVSRIQKCAPLMDLSLDDITADK